jgi:hypothetical protein
MGNQKRLSGGRVADGADSGEQFFSTCVAGPYRIGRCAVVIFYAPGRPGKLVCDQELPRRCRAGASLLVGLLTARCQLLRLTTLSGDFYAAALRSLGFGNASSEHTISEACLDAILLDLSW